MLPRSLTPAVLRARSDSPVVLVVGARQTGKTTLVQNLGLGSAAPRYLTLDDPVALGAAKSDPTSFIAGLGGPAILDEVQLAPELFPAIKRAVDQHRCPGRFLLTGSANVMLLPRLAESLAGRMEILTLWPLSQGEWEQAHNDFVDLLFSPEWPSLRPEPEGLDRLVDRIVRGGYPELLQRKEPDRRAAWFSSYLMTVLQRDVRDLSQIEGLAEMPRLLALLASRVGGLQSFSELSRSSAIRQTTLKRYMTLLEATYLIHPLPAWAGNLGQRLVKAPKVMLADTGLLAYLLGLDRERVTGDSTLFGHVLENFVAMEVRKQLTWSRTQARLFHLRTQKQEEVDLVLETPSGSLVGLEVKASAAIGSDDFRGLRALEQFAGPKFKRGVVLYTGQEAVSFGENLHALPVSGLWSPRH